MYKCIVIVRQVVRKGILKTFMQGCLRKVRTEFWFTHAGYFSKKPDIM